MFLLVILAGGLPFNKTFSDQPIILKRMTAIAAGFLIGAALLVAVPEGFEIFLHAFEEAEEHGHAYLLPNPLLAGLAVLAGFVFLLLLEGFGFGHDLHEEHHDHAVDHGHDHVNHPVGKAHNVVIGLSLHSIMDGLALGAAFALGEIVLSAQLALVVLMHKFPAAFSLSAYSLHERNDKRRSMIDLFLFAITTPIAMILAVQLFSSLDEAVVGLLLLFSAGSFIYVATVDVLPDIHIQGGNRETLWLVLTGIAVMVLISVFVAIYVPSLQHVH